ncbi:MAG: TIGR03089 family protein [Nigerium sp.]|nr:TIGR03089 family protein [Nigerium sp.]
MTPPPTVSTRLQRLARTAGSGPLITHYGPAGERTELSVTSFANWVAKTVNLLGDLGIEPGDTVTLPVLSERPAHWMALIWPFALWQAGLAVAVVSDAADADLVVTGPTDPRPRAPHTLACSLDPWARALTGLPAGVTDYSSEALAQPDAAPDAVVDAEALAWSDPARTLTASDLAALDPIADRLLARPSDPWQATSLLVRAILGGGSVVFVEGATDAVRTASAERARTLGPVA